VTVSSIKAQRVSVDPNDRQRAYLLAIFETDQEVEAEIRDLPYRPFQPRPKVSEWSPCSAQASTPRCLSHWSRNVRCNTQ
jgi:hypothetical protein